MIFSLPFYGTVCVFCRDVHGWMVTQGLSERLTPNLHQGTGALKGSVVLLEGVVFESNRPTSLLDRYAIESGSPENSINEFTFRTLSSCVTWETYKILINKETLNRKKRGQYKSNRNRRPSLLHMVRNYKHDSPYKCFFES